MTRGRRTASLFLALAALLVCRPAAADLPPAVAQALKQAGIPDTHVGIVVADVDAPVPLLAHGEKRSLNPASVMKLVTTLAALDGLGPAHVFKTRVWVEGEIRDGVLQGNLILQGGGDPGLTLERYWLLLREIRARGLREIRGDVLLDNTLYELDSVDPAAFDQSPLRPYNAPPSALLANFNTLNLRLGVNGKQVIAKLDAEDAFVLENRLEWVDGPCNNWREQLVITAQDGRLILSGRYPGACGEQSHPLNLLSPEATVAVLFRDLWKSLGGIHEGRIRPCVPDASAHLLMEFDSPPLSSLIRDVNKYSNNVMAQHVFLSLALQKNPVASFEGAQEVLLQWWRARLGDQAPPVVDNGAGLSREARVSALGLGRMLQQAWVSPVMPELVSSLPIVGIDGTLRRSKSKAGAAHLKSGSLRDVLAVAGYVHAASGRRYVLVAIVNHPSAAAARPVLDALVDWTGRDQ